MKYILAILLVVFFTSCREKTSKTYQWNPGERLAFVTGCREKAIVEFRGDSSLAIEYCRCMLRRLQETYPDMETANSRMTFDASVELAKQCLPTVDSSRHKQDSSNHF